MSDQVAARAIVIGVVVNTLFKVALALGVGTQRFRNMVLMTGAITISSVLLAVTAALLVWLALILSGSIDQRLNRCNRAMSMVACYRLFDTAQRMVI